MQRKVRTAARREARGTAELHAIVNEAREQGLSWQAIADALGISRQAATKRFGKVHEHDTEADAS